MQNFFKLKSVDKGKKMLDRIVYFKNFNTARKIFNGVTDDGIQIDDFGIFGIKDYNSIKKEIDNTFVCWQTEN